MVSLAYWLARTLIYVKWLLRSSPGRGLGVYLFLAFFWIVVAVIVQIYWDVLKQHAFIPIDRTVMGFIFFLLFSYNFLRWRMARSRQQQWEQIPQEPPPRPRVVDPPPDATFDFSDDDKKPRN
ncbi:MAG: hypothetical protein HY289_10170 [Planctomycetes bacterium]|nr:hypothetical protein [Planctomycetota bacterium]